MQNQIMFVKERNLQQILKLTVSTGCILIFHSLSVVVEDGTNTSQ